MISVLEYTQSSFLLEPDQSLSCNFSMAAHLGTPLCHTLAKGESSFWGGCTRHLILKMSWHSHNASYGGLWCRVLADSMQFSYAIIVAEIDCYLGWVMIPDLPWRF